MSKRIISRAVTPENTCFSQEGHIAPTKKPKKTWTLNKKEQKMDNVQQLQQPQRGERKTEASDDSTVWSYEVAGRSLRLLRVSMNLDGWTKLQVFQPWTETDGTRCLKATQTLFLTRPEAKAVFESFDQIRNELFHSIANPHQELPKPVGSKATEQEEADTCHQTWNVIDNGKRKVIMSYRMFEPENSKAVYVQVKMFTRETGQDNFVKHSGISMTLKEFEHLQHRLENILYFHD